MIDNVGRDIIEQRNGLGAAKKNALSIEDQQLLAKMRTNRQARAVLGIVAQSIKRGHDIAATVASPLPGTKDLATAMHSRLESVNRYAQKTYAEIPDNDEPISALHHKKVSVTLQQTRAALVDIGRDAEEMNAWLTGALADILSKALPPWLRPQDPKTKKAIVYVGIGVGALVVGAVVYKLVRNIFLDGASLGAAEEDALAIADAKRRRRHSRSAFSIS